MKATTLYIIVWIATTIAIMYACYITKTATPIWGFLLPLCLKVSD